MSTLTKKFQKAVFSLIIAVLAASIVTIVGFAGGPYNRSEGGSTSGNLWRYSGTQNKTTLASASCIGGYCAYLTQVSLPQNQTIYAWNMGTTNVSNIYDWCAYIPSIATAAVRYDVFEKNQTWFWNVLVNQANHQGQYVYLGFSDYQRKSVV